MTVTRVSTYNLHQTTLKYAGEGQADLAKLQTQISSGLKAQNFAELDGSVEHYTQVQNKLAKLQQYVDNNTVAVSRVDATTTSIQQINDVATQFKQLLITRRNAASGIQGEFEPQMRELWKTITGLLNNNVNGRYVFAGTRSNEKPVNDQNFPTNIVPGTPDDSYYSGSKENATMRVDDNYEIDYPVRADDPAFQKIMAAFAIAKEGGASSNDAQLSQAMDLVSQGLDGTASLIAKSSATRVSLDQANERHSNAILYWKGINEDLVNADIVGATTSVAVDQGILQATFQVFAKINSLQLSDFLR